MSDEDKDQKTEAPSEKRLREAMERGEFARSQELGVVCGLGAGLLADASSPQALRSFIASEAARWRPVIAEAGIRID